MEQKIKTRRKFLITIAALLFSFLLLSSASVFAATTVYLNNTLDLNYQPITYTLCTGTNFNTALKQYSDCTSVIFDFSFNQPDFMEKFEEDQVKPEADKEIKVSNVDAAGNGTIKLYYDSSTTIAYVLSEEEIAANANCKAMFSNKTKLTNITFTNFNTENVTNMNAMFMGCTGLTSLDLSSFDTSLVEDMHNMFDLCENLLSVDLTSFNTYSVKNMNLMFSDCSSLTEIKGLTTETLNLNFRTDNVGLGTDSDEAMDSMFRNCKSLTKLNLTTFNTENVGNMCAMFMGCTGLTSLDLSNFDTSSVL